MTIVADESVAAAILDRLRQDGLTGHAIRELAPGSTDKAVLETADGIRIRPGLSQGDAGSATADQ
jgi:hypothetical protein